MLASRRQNVCRILWRHTQNQRGRDEGNRIQNIQENIVLRRLVGSNVLEARSQNCEKRLLASSCPSVRPSGTRLPPGWFSGNLISDLFFRKSVEKIQVSLKSVKNNGYFTSRPIYICEKIKTHDLCSITFSPKSCRLWDKVENYGGANETTYDNTAHAFCMLGNEGYTQTFRMCNIYFPRENANGNTRQCYVTHILPILFILNLSEEMVTSDVPVYAETKRSPASNQPQCSQNGTRVAKHAPL